MYLYNFGKRQFHSLSIVNFRGFQFSWPFLSITSLTSLIEHYNVQQLKDWCKFWVTRSDGSGLKPGPMHAHWGGLKNIFTKVCESLWEFYRAKLAFDWTQMMVSVIWGPLLKIHGEMKIFLTLHFRFSIFELNFTKKWKFDFPKKSLFLHESLKGDLIWQIPSFGFSQMPIWPCRTPTGFH